jgi:hypothetical protein
MTDYKDLRCNERYKTISWRKDVPVAWLDATVENPFGSGMFFLHVLNSADARKDRRRSVILSCCLLESPHLCTILFGS